MSPKLFEDISKDILVDLYLNQKLSTAVIANKLNIKSHVTILNYLKKFSISRRPKLGNRKFINLSKDVLIDLYYNKKLTQKQIAKKFGNQSASGVQRLMKIHNIKTRNYSEYLTKYPKFDFHEDLTKKAYLIGFRLGDLNVLKVHELIQVRCSTTIKEQVNLIENLFSNYGKVQTQLAKRGTFETGVLLNKSFDFLLPKKDFIEKWILENNKYFLSFLGGYTDAEGSYFIREPYYKTHKPKWGVFEIQSYDKIIMCTIFRKIKEFGIKSTFYVNNRKTRYRQSMYRITIARKQQLWNFIKLIEPYHKHEGKLGDLMKVKENLLLRNSLPYCKPIVV